MKVYAWCVLLSSARGSASSLNVHILFSGGVGRISPQTATAADPLLRMTVHTCSLPPPHFINPRRHHNLTDQESLFVSHLRSSNRTRCSHAKEQPRNGSALYKFRGSIPCHCSFSAECLKKDPGLGLVRRFQTSLSAIPAGLGDQCFTEVIHFQQSIKHEASLAQR